MVQFTFQATGPYPIDDRRGKGFEYRFEDNTSGATVTVFVPGTDPKVAQATAVQAAGDAAKNFSGFKAP